MISRFKTSSEASSKDGTRLRKVNMKPFIWKLLVQFRFRWQVFTVLTFSNWLGIFLRHLVKKGHYILKVRRGPTFVADDKRYILPTIVSLFWCNEYGTLAKTPKEARVIVDLGANIGAFTLLILSRFPNSHVFAYEPNLKNVSDIRRSLLVNGVSERCTFFEKAIAGTNERRTFYVGERTDTDSLIARPNKKAITVECETLEDVFRKNNISHCDLLKMDIEGAEYEVLLTTPKKTFDLVDRLIFEWHEETQGNSRLLEVLRHLQGCGFECEVDVPYHHLITAKK